MKSALYTSLIFLISCVKSFGQVNGKSIFWHDAAKTTNIQYYHFTDSKNYFDITIKNNTAMSYVVYLPDILNYPMPIGDVNSPFLLNERNKDSLILHFSGPRTDGLNMLIRKIKVSFNSDYTKAQLKIFLVKEQKIEEVNLVTKRVEFDDNKVIEDINTFCAKNNIFTSMEGVKDLKCINYVDNNIISATFLVGGFKYAKSVLTPITFDRKTMDVLNNKKDVIPDSIRNQFISYDYSNEIKTAQEKNKEKMNLNISYFLYNKNKVMYYCFLYTRKFDDEFYHYGIQIPAKK